MLDRSRRVLFIVENLPVPFDRRVWSEATALRRAGYEVSVICPKGMDAQESEICLEGINVYRHALPIEAQGKFAFLLEYAIALMWEFALSVKVLWRHGFDAIHACNPPDTIFLIGAFYKLFGKKFVFDQHDINPELYEAKFQRRDALYRCLLLLERLTFKTADISIATNESYRKIAIERGRMKPENVFVVRSGPRLDWMTELPPVEALRRGRKFLVGYVGVIGEQEGIDLLVQSVRHIVRVEGRRDVQFRVVGGGPALEKARRWAVELEVADFIDFTGRVPDRDLLELLSTADVCVNPDRVNEMNDKSTMNKIMEYMAMGRPIVQFDVTEGRVSAQQASLYAKPNDPVDMAEKILALLDDPERRLQMSRFGRHRARTELSWPNEEPKLLAGYATLFPDMASSRESAAIAVPSADPLDAEAR